MASRDRVYRRVLCDFLSPSLSLNISNLRLVHSGDASFCVQCNIDGCPSVFQVFSAFSSHVYRRHRVALGLEKPIKETGEGLTIPQTHTNQERHDDMDRNEQDHNDERNICNQSSIADRVFQQSLSTDYTSKNAEFLMDLSEGKRLSQVAIDKVISGCKTIYDQAVVLFKEEAEIKLKDAGIDPSIVAGID